ncbi:MAG: hypothetical protein GYA51_05825 [Candidatus Methanofastidiosa archaeon]|nr:hypothetical protein [Candidatus Methanofastidiosa archaeon]
MKELIIKSANTVEELISQWEAKQELHLIFCDFPKFEVIRPSARLIANDLVTVQPMAAPTGVFHYIDYVYNGTPDRPFNERHHDCGIEKTLSE